MPITGTVPVTGRIAPTSELDTYPVTDPSYGLGGLRTVASIAERNGIFPSRRQVGMLVYVSNENKYYSLTGGIQNTNWFEFVGGGGITGPRGERGDPGPTGPPGLSPTSFVSSLNSLTGALQISAGSNIRLTVEGNNTLVITSLDSTFDSDITASIPNNRSFGKYAYGERIPAAGKTAVEVIREALFDVIQPSLGLTSNSSVLFNQTSVSINLFLRHNIQTVGATGASGYLQFRRGNDPGWQTLGTNFFSPTSQFFSGTTTHSISDSAYNTNNFNYRYIVFDSRGASAEVPLTITGGQDRPPTVTLSVSASQGIRAGLETQLSREKGNTVSTLSATVERRNSFVPLSGWFSEYRINNSGSWIRLLSGTFVGQGSTYNISVGQHTPETPSTNNINSIDYRLTITDGSDPDGRPPTTSTVVFNNLIWYGATGAAPTTSNNIRNNGLIAFNPNLNGNNPFNLETGTSATRFVVAMPAPRQITSVTDRANNSYTAFFVTAAPEQGWSGLATVNNFANIPVPYNVYTFFVNEPYSQGSETLTVTRNIT